MTTVTDTELFSDADRVKNRVVLITGAANGFGKATALLFAKHGAKIVIGDTDLKSAEAVVSEIKLIGSDAVAQKCDVTSWEQQLSLFQLAVRIFKRIDIVVPNAGVSELGNIYDVRKDAVNGPPTKPNIKTLDVDIASVIYTAHLALYYLQENNASDLKSIIFIGSMASLESIPAFPIYSAAKHGVLGFMKALHGNYRDSIRVAIICPGFADTNIAPKRLKFAMAAKGIPFTPISRVAGAIFKAATDTEAKTNGAIWTLLDDGPVMRVDHAQTRIDQGIYKLLNNRASARLKPRL